MDFDTFKRAVDSLDGRFGTTGIMGGEPTLHPEFERFVDYLYDKTPAEYRARPREFVYPQRDFMRARDYANEGYSEVHHFQAGTRNVVCGGGLWSSMNRSYKKHYEFIQDSFKYQIINDHNNAMYHQPIMITRKELGIDDKTFKHLRDNCWVQQLWSGAITPKGAFFCEIAAALDMLLDGPGGWPIEKGWWKRREDDFGSQLDWCEMCGIALETFSRDAREEIDDASPFWMGKLKALNSPKLKNGKVNSIKIKNCIIDEASTPRGRALTLESGGEPYADNHDDKFNRQKSILYPSGFDGVIIVKDKDTGVEDALRSKYASVFDTIQFIYESEHFGGALNRVFAAAHPDKYIIIFTENVLLNNPAVLGLKECIINPGTLHYIDFSHSKDHDNGYFENYTSLKSGFAALLSKRALSLRKFGFDRIAASRDIDEIRAAWYSGGGGDKVIQFHPQMEHYPEPRKSPASPLISFVIPFYKRFGLLKEAVHSIADSAFKNVEIILVDDGSGEDGKDDLLEFMNNIPNIVYIWQQENTGPGAVRNRGLKRAKGEWVFFMDSDDVIYSEKLPELADFLAKEQTSDIIVFSDTKYKFPDNRIETRHYSDGVFDETVNNFRNDTFGGTLWHFCYKRSFLTDKNIWFPETYISDDETFSTAAYFCAKQISYFNDYFYEYRLYTNLSINSQIEHFDYKSEKMSKGRSEYFNRLLELYESSLPDGRREYVENFIYEYILCTLWEPERYRDNRAVKQALERLHGTVARFSENWSRKLYIAPCFIGAVNALTLIKSWGGDVAGAVDNDPLSGRAEAFKKVSGLGVHKAPEIIRGGGGIILFSKHSEEIAGGFEALGLVSGKDYLKTGVL
jgi:glycosyltransferase involved in cell wall biosynthesis